MDTRLHRELGAACFGPLMLQFTSWLCRTAAEREISTLYFLSREGHFLQAAYEKFLALGLNGDVPATPCRYLLISRRAVFGAAIKDRTTLRQMLDAGMFDGSMHEMLRVRLGEAAVRAVPKDRTVSLPRDTDRVLDALVEALPQLNEAASEERAGLLAYAKRSGLLDTPRVGLVDLGYSGTIQRHLHVITGVPLTGFYFATTSRTKKWESDANRSLTCFGESCELPDEKIPAFRYALALESWLTSPDPQLVRFDPEGEPVFGDESTMQRRFAELEAIDAGVHDYFEDVAHVGGGKDDLSWFAQEVMVSALHAERYKDVVGMLSIEDRFCGNDEIPIAHRLQKWLEA